jgi:cytochrome P450
MIGLMMAGYETTNETLLAAVHTLATRPEEMLRLQEEIDSEIQTLVI